MGRKYAIRDKNQFYFVTFTVVNWIDVFSRQIYRDLFLESVRYCQKEKGLDVGAWCIMTNHVHMILGTNGDNPLQNIIRDLKSYTSRHIRKMMEGASYESRKWMLDLMYCAGTKKSNNKDFQFWLQHNHPVELNTNFMMDQRLGYIHYNPVKAGFVNDPSAWLYSSARDYRNNEKGLLDLVFLV